MLQLLPLTAIVQHLRRERVICCLFKFSRKYSGLFANAPRKGSRFKVGVQGSRRQATIFISCFSKASAPRNVRACRSPAGRPRVHPRNCCRFWTFLSSSCVESVNSQRDGAPGGPHPRNCGRFWTLLSSWRVKRVNSHRKGAPRGPWESPSSQLSLLLDPRVVRKKSCEEVGQGSRERC